MKRIFAAIISIIIAGSIASCGTKENTSDKDESETKATTATTTAAETTVATAAEVTTTAETTTAVETTTTAVETTTENETTIVSEESELYDSIEDEENADDFVEAMEALDDWNSTKKYDFEKFIVYIPYSYNYDGKGNFTYYGGTITLASLGKGDIQDPEIKKQIIDTLVQSDDGISIDEEKYSDDGILLVNATYQLGEEWNGFYRLAAFSSSDQSVVCILLFDATNSRRADILMSTLLENLEIL